MLVLVPSELPYIKFSPSELPRSYDHDVTRIWFKDNNLIQGKLTSTKYYTLL